jgi:hypothetical protein
MSVGDCCTDFEATCSAAAATTTTNAGEMLYATTTLAPSSAVIDFKHVGTVDVGQGVDSGVWITIDYTVGAEAAVFAEEQLVQLVVQLLWHDSSSSTPTEQMLGGFSVDLSAADAAAAADAAVELKQTLLIGTTTEEATAVAAATADDANGTFKLRGFFALKNGTKVEMVGLATKPVVPNTRSATTCATLGWDARQLETFPSVCAASEINGTCLNREKYSFTEAFTACEAVGARLCTLPELAGNVGPVRVFRQTFALEDAIGSYACSLEANICSLEANMRVTNGIPLGSSLLLPVCTVNFVQTLKVPAQVATSTMS